MSKGVAGKIKINTYNDLVGGNAEEVTEVSLSELHEFKNHPFRVRDDDGMREMTESVKKHGILVPGIVRVRDCGGYEIISGHRRKRACELAGLDRMPVFIKDYTEDQATVVMVDANIQREDILPSEKARAYRMKYDAMKHQGARTGGLSLEVIGEAAGESGKTVQRYLWLSRLIDDLMDFVDEKKLSFVAGVDLSSLNEKEQRWVLEVIRMEAATVSSAQSAKLKKFSLSKELTKAMVQLILLEEKPKSRKFVMKSDKLNLFFEEETSDDEIEEVIMELLKQWKKRGGKK